MDRIILITRQPTNRIGMPTPSASAKQAQFLPIAKDGQRPQWVGDWGVEGDADRRSLAVAPPALMCSLLIVLHEPRIEIGLQLGNRAIELFAKRHAVELIEQRFVEPLADEGTQSP